MKLIEKMAREHADSRCFAGTTEHKKATADWLAGFRAAREMAAQRLMIDRERRERAVRMILAVEAAAIRQLGEAEEGNPT